jgi:DNA modification methylase
MRIEMWPVERVKPYESNPRINDDAVDAVAASIREFGFRQPIVVDAEGVIVVGHTRWKAAKNLGLTEVPVHVATDLTAEQIRAYRIADNRLAELAEWNYDVLPIELSQLGEAGFDLQLLGFDPDELAQLLDPGVKDGLTDPDDVPEPPDEAITQPGDLWILGEHRLLCGDSGNAEHVDRLLDGAAIHLVNTDPPYNVKLEPRSNNAIAAGLSSFQGTTHHQSMDLARHPEKAKPTRKKLRPKDRPLANDFVSDEEFDRLLDAWFGNLARVLLPGRGFYIWGGYANCANYPPFLRKHSLYFSQAIIWDKEHPVLTRKDYMGAHEWCQPPDTQVLTPSGSVSIASLRNRDRVVSFSRHHPAMVGLRDGLDTCVTSRPFDGSLYGVDVENRTTWCTDGHIWSVRMTPAAKSKWCVYLMQRGNWWRVGRCKLYTTWGLGVKQRLMMESGEAAWLLAVYDDKDEATLGEQIVSAAYGIPTTFWNEQAPSRRTEAMVRRIYEYLDLDQLERSARRALSDHHRSVFCPFITRGQTGHKHNGRVSLLVRGCNLLPEAMAVPVPRKGQSVDWVPIRAVDVQSYRGPVYSLGVEKYYHYVADGIVTHNCFYGWKEGAAHRFYGPNNAQDLWHIKKIPPQQLEHLTGKPAELAVRAIQYSSVKGENVLDLFGGSGSTMIGAEQTGRRTFLMEIDPLYCDVIADRFQRFTGKPAVLERTGESPIPMKPREENMR